MLHFISVSKNNKNAHELCPVLDPGRCASASTFCFIYCPFHPFRLSICPSFSPPPHLFSLIFTCFSSPSEKSTKQKSKENSQYQRWPRLALAVPTGGSPGSNVGAGTRKTGSGSLPVSECVCACTSVCTSKCVPVRLRTVRFRTPTRTGPPCWPPSPAGE